MVSFFRRCCWGLLVIVYLGFSVQPVRGQIQPGPTPISPIPPTRTPPQRIDNNKIDDNKVDDIFRNWPRIEEQNDTNVALNVRHVPKGKKSADGKFVQAAFVVVLIVAGLTVLWVIARIFIGLRFSRDPQELALHDPSVRAHLNPTKGVSATTQRS
jgi:hypothetical protein